MVLRRRLLGLVFFIVVGLFIATTLMKFNNTFTDYTTVRLVTDSAGNSLSPNADVKARGVVVGQVASTEADPEGGDVIVNLKIDPGKARLLPTATTARILPKTLFGERYVALQVPLGTVSGPTLSSGDTINQDASGNALEVQQLFDKLLPLLQAIPPQDLNVTLGALSRALDGNGEKIGNTLDQLNTIFTGINQNMPELQGALTGLASFAQTYSTALPDVVDALDTLRITSKTLVAKQTDLSSLISTLTQASTDTTGFLTANRQPLLDLTISSAPLIASLAKYSPSYACTFKVFAGLMPRADKIVGKGTKNPGVHVSLRFVNPRGRYLPNQDEPRLFDINRDPVCFEPTTNGRPFPQYPGGSYNDGSYQVPSRNPGPRYVQHVGPVQYSATPAGSITPSVYDDPRNRLAMKAIMASQAGTDPSDVPDWIGTLMAPALAGSEVTIK